MYAHLATRAGRAALVLVLVFAPTARGEPVRTIDAPRILVSDVAGGGMGGDVELGPAPPPGGSRLVERREVEDRLREAGVVGAKVDMPSVVRIQRAVRRMTPMDLEMAAEPLLRAALPPGVTLVGLRFARAVAVPPHVAIRKVTLPKLPRRAGATKTTVMFELAEGAEVYARVPGAVTLEVSERAAQPAVLRGARLDIVIEKGPARVTAVGSALSDADVGDVISVRVDSTKRTLEARIESSELAKVVRK